MQFITAVLIACTIIFCKSVFAHSQELVIPPSGFIYCGKTGRVEHLEEVARLAHPGAVIIISEIHDNVQHHEHQVSLLETVARLAPEQSLNVGMEFIPFTRQAAVDNFLLGKIDEKTFKEEVTWKGNFDFYRTQILFPASHQGKTIALNAPSELTSKISRMGLASLTTDEKVLLPPHFELGNKAYFERFKQVMESSHPLPEEKLQHYFEAQSVWDDTMAWTAAQYMRGFPNAVLIIIVGDFHVQYGGGLPDRLIARGVQQLMTISQVDVTGLSQSEIDALVLPDAHWGQRADFVWTSD
ncbi:MAG: ChaN family lipoprotein [Deltaproteobacteria bacterium]|nr:ChaN family lipoprotein [Deltaproteobacteria bacterium]